MGVSVQVVERLAVKFRVVFPHLDERPAGPEGLRHPSHRPRVRDPAQVYGGDAARAAREFTELPITTGNPDQATAGLDSHTREDCYSAAPLMQHLLRNQSRDLLLRYLLETPAMAWGASAGLADIVITARANWADATDWLRSGPHDPPPAPTYPHRLRSPTRIPADSPSPTSPTRSTP
jgi:hypothetical protein